MITVFCFSVYAESKWYDKPFIFPGRHRAYYKESIEPYIIPLDFENYKECGIKVLVDKDEVFPHALQLMESAEESIMFNMYLFGGKLGEKIIKILKSKMEQGVKVYCVLPEPKDSISDGEVQEFFEEDFFRNTTRSGEVVKPPYYEKISLAVSAGLPVVHAETKFLDTPGLVKIDHSKIIIVDSKIAMIGGMNFADTVAKNRDSMVEVVGPYVEEIEKVFINNWICGYANEKDYSKISKFNRNESENIMKNRISTRGYLKAEAVTTVTAPYGNNTKEALIRMFDNAKNSIYIEQLLFNEKDILKSVAKAAKRGVVVKILLDPAIHLYSLDWKGGPNNKAVGVFQKLNKEKPELDAEVRHYDILPGQELHMKLSIVDGEYVGLGSTNFTSGAMRSNYEAFTIFKSRELAYVYENIFMDDWENRSVKPAKLNFGEKIIGVFSDILF